MRLRNARARCPRLSKVEPRVTIVSLSATSALTMRVGRGVVVTIICGFSPSLRPSIAWSKASGPAPGGELVAPQLHVLLAAQPVRLLGGEELAHRAVRPFEPSGRGADSAAAPRARQQARMPDSPEHHHVAHVVGGRADQVDERKRPRPSPDRLGAGAGLARAAAGQDQPDDPVAGRRLLVGARPEIPVAQKLLAVPSVIAARMRAPLVRTAVSRRSPIRRIGGRTSPAAASAVPPVMRRVERRARRRRGSPRRR